VPRRVTKIRNLQHSPTRDVSGSNRCVDVWRKQDDAVSVPAASSAARRVSDRGHPVRIETDGLELPFRKKPDAAAVGGPERHRGAFSFRKKPGSSRSVHPPDPELAVQWSSATCDEGQLFPVRRNRERLSQLLSRRRVNRPGGELRRDRTPCREGLPSHTAEGCVKKHDTREQHENDDARARPCGIDRCPSRPLRWDLVMRIGRPDGCFEAITVSRTGRDKSGILGRVPSACRSLATAVLMPVSNSRNARSGQSRCRILHGRLVSGLLEERGEDDKWLFLNGDDTPLPA